MYVSVFTHVEARGQLSVSCDIDLYLLSLR